nr:amino acid permease 6-like [Ipomoea batatas]
MQANYAVLEKNREDYFNVKVVRQDEERSYGDAKLDDDGLQKRTGTTAHIITAVIGSGVLSLAWAFAQLGWIAGPVSLLVFAVITWYTSVLLADCYRCSDGKRNYTYMDAVTAHLGGSNVKVCGTTQHSNLVGTGISYTITTALSMSAISKSNCYHKYGHGADCKHTNNTYIILFGVAQIILSQIPNFHKLSFLSLVAAVMSFTYSSIGLGLSIDRIAIQPALVNTKLAIRKDPTVGKLRVCTTEKNNQLEYTKIEYLFLSTRGGHVKTSLMGQPIGGFGADLSSADKMWNTFAALGDIAFAYSFSNILVEIQDTIKASPRENKVMKQATFAGIAISTVFYMLCGVLGYAAFGNDAPSNFLTGFGFYDPLWLIDLANVCIIVHLLGAYQVFTQPLFAFVEEQCKRKWPESRFVNHESTIKVVPALPALNFSVFRLVWRSAYVVVTTFVSMLLPFFNDFVGLIGAAAFWPLTVYFPIEMYIARAKIRRLSFTWVWLQILSVVCFIISVVASAGCIRGLIQSVKTFQPFHVES